MKKMFIKVTNMFISILLIICAVIPLSGCFFDDKEDEYNNEVYYLNEYAKNKDGVEFIITDIENTNHIGSGYLADTTENNFILLTIKATNKGKKDQTIYSGCVELYNSNNVEYDDYYSLNINDIAFLGNDIGVGMTTTFQVVFEVPTNTDQTEYVVRIGYSIYTSDKDRVYIKLKNRDGSPTTSGSSSSGSGETFVSHAMNETFTFLGLEFKVTSWDRSWNYSASNSNNKFVDVRITIYNPSNKAIDTEKLTFTFVYDNNVEYNARWGYIADYVWTFDSIDPLETVNALVGFEIPKLVYEGSKKCQLKVKENSIYADEFHYVTLREDVLENN